MKQQALSLVVLGALAIALTFAPADEARAQAGDLDILSRSVPPIVMIQFDTSGSMQNIILPDKYVTDRGAGTPTVSFNRITNNRQTPAGAASPPPRATAPPAPPRAWSAVRLRTTSSASRRLPRPRTTGPTARSSRRPRPFRATSPSVSRVRRGAPTTTPTTARRSRAPRCAAGTCPAAAPTCPRA